MKITYVLGAGASAKAIPTIRNFKNEFLMMASHLRTHHYVCDYMVRYGYPAKQEFDSLYKTRCEQMSEELLVVAELMGPDVTIDVAARILSQRQDYKNLARLRCALEFFITAKCWLEGESENRYRDLISYLGKTSLDRGFYIPGNVNVISWNYDFLFERAYATMFDGIKTLQDVYHHIELRNESWNQEGTRFQLIKLNGTCGTHIHNGTAGTVDLPITNVHLENTNEGVKEITRLIELYNSRLDYCTDPYKKFEIGIQYAWNKEDYALEKRKNAASIIRASDVVVIIGYSFDRSNHVIDNQLYRDFPLDSKPTYVQGTINGAEGMRNSFIEFFDPSKFKISTLDANGNLRVVEDENRFEIPSEYLEKTGDY